jgi:acyl dehydratase
MIVRPWTVTARNLPEHARNPIHTDEGAQAAGFPRALVAGVTTYAYLTHPLIEAGGADHLAGSRTEVAFRSPVFLDDEVLCQPRVVGTDVIVSAWVDGQERATVRASRSDQPAPELRDGERLRSYSLVLEGEFGDEYGSRAGDDLRVCTDLGLVHPAVWPALANHVVHAQVANGSWIHTNSIIDHHRLVPVGSTAEVSSVVVRRLDSRAGVRAVLDVRIEVDGEAVVTIEHHAIVDVTRRVPPR